MKSFIRSTLFISIIVAMSLCIVSCSGGIKGDEAKAYINEFFSVIETGNYKQAETYLHPERPADLESFFEGLIDEKSLDFSSIEIKRYTGFSSSLYDSTVAGSAYSLTIDVLLCDTEVEIEVEVVRNDNGFGIYNFDLDT